MHFSSFFHKKQTHTHTHTHTYTLRNSNPFSAAVSEEGVVKRLVDSVSLLSLCLVCFLTIDFVLLISLFSYWFAFASRLALVLYSVVSDCFPSLSSSFRNSNPTLCDGVGSRAREKIVRFCLSVVVCGLVHVLVFACLYCWSGYIFACAIFFSFFPFFPFFFFFFLFHLLFALVFLFSISFQFLIKTHTHALVDRGYSGDILITIKRATC